MKVTWNFLPFIPSTDLNVFPFNCWKKKDKVQNVTSLYEYDNKNYMLL